MVQDYISEVCTSKNDKVVVTTSMRFFPDSALVQLEFDKIQSLLTGHCKTEYAKSKSAQLRIHIKREFIELELQQTNEYKLLLQGGQYFPNDYVLNLSKEIKLLGIPGAVLAGEQFMEIRKLKVFSGGSIQNAERLTRPWYM